MRAHRRNAAKPIPVRTSSAFLLSDLTSAYPPARFPRLSPNFGRVLARYSTVVIHRNTTIVRKQNCLKTPSLCSSPASHRRHIRCPAAVSLVSNVSQHLVHLEGSLCHLWRHLCQRPQDLQLGRDLCSVRHLRDELETCSHALAKVKVQMGQLDTLAAQVRELAAEDCAVKLGEPELDLRPCPFRSECAPYWHAIGAA